MTLIFQLPLKYLSGLAFSVLGCLALASGGAEAARLVLQNWETIRSEKFGFMIAYPGNVFVPDTSRLIDGGHVLVSRDGSARLLVATFENESGATLAEYRQHLISDKYATAEMDYMPMKKSWFVLSGNQDGMHFYYKVSLTCGGRLINSWALMYPTAERYIYDHIVEAVARTYSPGAGARGNCE